MAGIAVPQQTQKRDTLGELLQGLQLAATGFGIYKDYSSLQNQKEQLDMMKADEQRKIDAAAGKAQAEAAVSGGLLDIPTQAKLKQEGWREGTEGAPNAVPFEVVQLGGGTKKGFFLPPMSKGEEFAAKTKSEGEKLTSDTARQNYERNLKNALDLRDRYDKDPITQQTKMRMQSYSGIQAAASSENPSGASDMSLIFQYMKMLDPGSTVREGEYATASQTTTIPGRIVNKYNELIATGQKLDPKQREDFLREAKALLVEQLKHQETVDKRYEQDAKKWNITDTSMVVDPTFAEAYKEIQKQKSGNMLSQKKKSGSLPFENTATAKPTFDDTDIDMYLKGSQ